MAWLITCPHIPPLVFFPRRLRPPIRLRLRLRLRPRLPPTRNTLELDVFPSPKTLLNWSFSDPAIFATYEVADEAPPRIRRERERERDRVDFLVLRVCLCCIVVVGISIIYSPHKILFRSVFYLLRSISKTKIIKIAVIITNIINTIAADAYTYGLISRLIKLTSGVIRILNSFWTSFRFRMSRN